MVFPNCREQENIFQHIALYMPTRKFAVLINSQIFHYKLFTFKYDNITINNLLDLNVYYCSFWRFMYSKCTKLNNKIPDWARQTSTLMKDNYYGERNNPMWWAVLDRGSNSRFNNWCRSTEIRAQSWNVRSQMKFIESVARLRSLKTPMETLYKQANTTSAI